MDKAFRFYDPGKLQDGHLELVLTNRVAADPIKQWAPSYKFAMRLVGNSIDIGTIDLRIGNSDNLKLYGGHIGYGVNREHRGRRYAARSVRLLLPLAARHGINPVWITCNPDNIASRRSCEIAGGEFVEIVNLPVTSDMYRRGERQKCRYRFDTATL